MVFDPLVQFVNGHPWFPYVVLLCSYVLSAFAPAIVGRWPWLAKPLDLLMHVLSALPGRVQATQRAALAARAAPKMPGGPFVPPAALMMALALLGAGCTAQQKRIAVGVLDVSGAACTQLEKQANSPYIDLACAVTDVATGVVTTFFMRVRPEQAAVLTAHSEAKQCP